MDNFSKTFSSEEELDNFLSEPYPLTIEMMKRLEGDIIILGAGGKMGPTLANLALLACKAADVKKRIIAVDLFPDNLIKGKLEKHGIETIKCDLLNYEEVAKLPKVKNVIYMAGRKFGEKGSETLTWMINVIASNNVASAFKGSNIVAFSTGCVYSLMSAKSQGSLETDFPLPVGEYANSCLGRERIFQFYSERYKTKLLILRLNYAVELRYGVLVDIAQNVYNKRPVDISVVAFNFIWQGDANNRALLCLEKTSSPPEILNITGSKIYSTKETALEFGKLFDVKVEFVGENQDKAYLSNAEKSIRLFGEPKIQYQQIIRWIADWIKGGGANLGKPTHFTVTDGQFLD